MTRTPPLGCIARWAWKKRSLRESLDSKLGRETGHYSKKKKEKVKGIS